MMHLYSAFIVYCHTPKALYNHVGGGVSPQPPPVCSIHLDDATAATGQRRQCAHHTPATGGEEREIEPIKWLQIDIKVSMSKTEVKGLIANEIRNKWQKEWDSGRKGRHLYHIQEKVGLERRKYGNRKDDVLMSRMRIGHCLLNQ